MASKKRQKSVKQNLQDASNVQMKTDNQKSHKTASLDDDEEEDALEMERNFALFSKRGSVQTSKMIQDETSGEESDEAVEDEENTDEEHDHSGDFVKERTDMTGSEDSYNQRDCKRNNTSSIKAELKPDLSTMSFEEIMRLQSKIGTKAYNKLIHEAKKKKQDLEPAKRLNKDRPQEISAKKPVSFFRKVGSAKGPILRDPRFDDLSGEFKPEVFSQTYKFINDIKQQEAEMVKKKLKKVKSNAKKEELKSFLKRMSPCRVTESPCRVTESPCRVTESPCRVTESPCRVTESPCRVTESPCRVTESPCRVTESPCRVTESPCRVTESPCRVTESPCRVTESPCRVTESPCRVTESPCRENQKRNLERREQQREKELSYKRKQRALVGDGHRPFYLKKSDKKKLELAEKYSELKKSGKLENFLSKKRKRNAVKDRRKMP
ncbi:hypothetical protein QTP86_027183 [Hemibagrus guttatus]|nr:hypothetical protein QTP86_027183 [Hemibagrus guttatus]